eukprot:TRINITY_DN47524_c0_g1_i1.p1 TRINITY_DN47524_c0_g1~~TRINITY_DN47524_c0_g1_i1.p1  ORF type:complete len:317 (+),score=88.84 TRINITY_DN47524_c0_g1_i1:61-1011(+)
MRLGLGLLRGLRRDSPAQKPVTPPPPVLLGLGYDEAQQSVVEEVCSAASVTHLNPRNSSELAAALGQADAVAALATFLTKSVAETNSVAMLITGVDPVADALAVRLTSQTPAIPVNAALLLCRQADVHRSVRGVVSKFRGCRLLRTVCVNFELNVPSLRDTLDDVLAPTRLQVTVGDSTDTEMVSVRSEIARKVHALRGRPGTLVGLLTIAENLAFRGDEPKYRRIFVRSERFAQVFGGRHASSLLVDFGFAGDDTDGWLTAEALHVADIHTAIVALKRELDARPMVHSDPTCLAEGTDSDNDDAAANPLARCSLP